MKLGVIAHPSAESFEWANGKRLDFLEFCVHGQESTDHLMSELPRLKAASEQTGVSVESVGCWGTVRVNEDGTLNKEELSRSMQLIDAAQALGCTNYVCGVNYVEGLSYYDNVSAAIGYFSRLIEYGKAKGVAISSYNCNWSNYIDRETAWTIVHGHLGDLGIKFDPSHSRYGGRDYLDETKRWGHRFKHVHIKGSVIVGGERVDDPPAGLDQTDWGTFLSILYKQGYQGGLSIEPHSSTWTGELGDRGLDYTIDYMKRLLFR